jgi:hypothetical protein
MPSTTKATAKKGGQQSRWADLSKIGFADSVKRCGEAEHGRKGLIPGEIAITLAN